MYEKWHKVVSLLNKDFDLHQYTIFYWCCWENEDINDCWDVTPLMREFWSNSMITIKHRPNQPNLS